MYVYMYVLWRLFICMYCNDYVYHSADAHTYRLSGNNNHHMYQVIWDAIHSSSTQENHDSDKKKNKFVHLIWNLMQLITGLDCKVTFLLALAAASSSWSCLAASPATRTWATCQKQMTKMCNIVSTLAGRTWTTCPKTYDKYVDKWQKCATL